MNQQQQLSDNIKNNFNNINNSYNQSDYIHYLLSYWFLFQQQFPTFSSIFIFKHEFNYQNAFEWMYNNYQISCYIAFSYGNIVLIGDMIMFKRPNPISLRKWFILWNVIITIFSIVGFCRILPELITTLRDEGFYQVTCSNQFYTQVIIIVFFFDFIIDY